MLDEMYERYHLKIAEENGYDLFAAHDVGYVNHKKFDAPRCVSQIGGQIALD